MNAPKTRTDDAPDLGRLIDRLVDGELPEEARRALLVRLDAEPDSAGWRRFALAFLEADAWRDSMDGPAAAPAPEPSVNPTPVAAPVRRLGGPVRLTGLAASLACAFIAGRGVRPPVSGPVPPFPPANAVALSPVTAEVIPAEVGPDPDPDPEDWRSLDGREPSRPRGVDGSYWRPSPSSPVRAEGGPWAWTDPPAPPEVPGLPAPVIEDWRRRGYEVEERPRYVSVGRGDDGPVAVPVNDVRVRYVGDRTY